MPLPGGLLPLHHSEGIKSQSETRRIAAYIAKLPELVKSKE